MLTCGKKISLPFLENLHTKKAGPPARPFLYEVGKLELVGRIKSAHGNAAVVLTFALVQKCLNAPQRLQKMIHRIGVGDTDKSFAGFAESVARNHRDLLGIQKLLAELGGGKAGGLDAGKDVKRAFR